MMQCSRHCFPLRFRLHSRWTGSRHQRANTQSSTPSGFNRQRPQDFNRQRPQVFLNMASLLEREERDLDFAEALTDKLALILLTAPETHALRGDLVDDKQKAKGGLFHTLYACWCLCPVAALSLCLVASLPSPPLCHGRPSPLKPPRSSLSSLAPPLPHFFCLPLLLGLLRSCPPLKPPLFAKSPPELHIALDQYPHSFATPLLSLTDPA